MMTLLRAQETRRACLGGRVFQSVQDLPLNFSTRDLNGQVSMYASYLQPQVHNYTQAPFRHNGDIHTNTGLYTDVHIPPGIWSIIQDAGSVASVLVASLQELRGSFTGLQARSVGSDCKAHLFWIYIYIYLQR